MWTPKIGQVDKLRIASDINRNAEVISHVKETKVHPPEFKAKVSLEAIKGLKTTSELASQFKIHPVQISSWKKQAIVSLPETFKQGKTTRQSVHGELIVMPLREADRALGSESTNGSYSTLFAI